MDFRELARRFVNNGYSTFRHGPQKEIDASMRGESFVLFYLWQHAASIPPSDLSAAMNVSTARVATALNSLENKGLVTRRINTDDRRMILVDLTEQGRCLAEQRHADILDHTTRMFEQLGEHDAVEFVRIWERLAQIMPDVAGTPPCGPRTRPAPPPTRGRP